MVSRNYFTRHQYVHMRKLSQGSLYPLLGLWFDGVPVRDIATQYNVSPRRVYQIISHYKKTGHLPKLKNPGRPANPSPPEDVFLVLDYHSRHHSGAVTLEHKIERERGIHIPHTRIHQILRENNLVQMSEKKRIKPKYVRYEREFSMELWQTDWKYFVYPDGRKVWLIAFMDDASRYITCYGIYDAATTENTIDTLKKGFQMYGVPEAILTDHGTQFTSGKAKTKENHAFEEFLMKNRVEHILARVRHPQTNGKIERFWGELEKRKNTFATIHEYVAWHNDLKPHMSLDYEEPVGVFWNKMLPGRCETITERLLNA